MNTSAKNCLLTTSCFPILIVVFTDLSNELVDLLMIREQLKTENEAKIVDIDDIKAIIKAVGPETSVWSLFYLLHQLSTLWFYGSVIENLFLKLIFFAFSSTVVKLFLVHIIFKLLITLFFNMTLFWYSSTSWSLTASSWHFFLNKFFISSISVLPTALKQTLLCKISLQKSVCI